MNTCIHILTLYDITCSSLQLPHTSSFNLMKIVEISLFSYLKTCNLLHKKLEKNPSFAWIFRAQQRNSRYLSIFKINKKGLSQQGYHNSWHIVKRVQVFVLGSNVAMKTFHTAAFRIPVDNWNSKLNNTKNNVSLERFRDFFKKIVTRFRKH